MEIEGRLAGLVATYDDGSGTDVDANDTHLMLNAGPCDFAANVFDETIHCKVGCTSIISIIRGVEASGFDGDMIYKIGPGEVQVVDTTSSCLLNCTGVYRQVGGVRQQRLHHLTS